VDLGVANIATDSDGVAYSGKALRATRRRHLALRRRLQAKGTKSAKRLLHKRRRRETRYARDINHCISKTLVGKAQDTGRGIALEDLQGIRDRITVRRAQRADLHSWSFHQLRAFIAYKAVMAGVSVRAVDPRNTSRGCSVCGHIDKRNRPTRDDFRCILCGHAAPADHNAAINIGRRAAVMQPDAA
jgi:putative transposase